jgi:hypothetical protein
MFALGRESALAATTDDGNGSNGVFVSIATGNFDADTIEYVSDSYLGKSDYPFVGPDQYPVNSALTVAATTSGAIPFGITLNQTAKNDENGEKLLYNATKKEELQAVLPGQTVPIATKGIFTLGLNAVDGGAGTNVFTVGTGIKISNTSAGKITGVAPTDSTSFGTVIGTGERTSTGGLTDQFVGKYVVVKIG